MHDKDNYFFTPGAAAYAKAVLKPGAVMLEIYGGAEYDIAPPSLPGIPWLSAVGGVQAGVRGGARSAVTIDFSVSASLLGGMNLVEDEAPYRSIKFCFLIGYKIGWRDHLKKSAAAPP
jgi:hypothetical protein